MGNGTAGSI